MTADLARQLARLRDGPFLVLGRAGMDLYADPPGAEIETASRFEATLGGSAANIAAALVRLGYEARLVTCVSDDAVGRFCLAQLDRYGIDRRHVRAVAGEARTSLAVVETRAENCQSVIYRNGAADFALTPADVAGLDYAGAAGLIVTGTALAAEPSRAATLAAMELAREAGLPVILDVDFRPYSWASTAEATAILSDAAGRADIVVGNDVEFGVLSGSAETGLAHARALAGRPGRIAVYKMGERGAVTLARATELRTGIYPATPLKPTGAGDAFMGGFVAALAQGRPLTEATLRGSAAAAIVVGRVGCAPAMPDTAEIDALVAASPAPIQPDPDATETEP